MNPGLKSKIFKMLFILLLLSVVASVKCQQIVYNTTHCQQGNRVINTSAVLPQFPPYAMTVSSSTYDAAKPITIQVKSCDRNQIQAFLMKAAIQGYVIRNFTDATKVKLGTITVSCGLIAENKNYIHYNRRQDIDLLQFRWLPPSGAFGNITFDFTAVPIAPSVFQLTFGKIKHQQQEEALILVEQRCSAAVFTPSNMSNIFMVGIFTAYLLSQST